MRAHEKITVKVCELIENKFSYETYPKTFPTFKETEMNTTELLIDNIRRNANSKKLSIISKSKKRKNERVKESNKCVHLELPAPPAGMWLAEMDDNKEDSDLNNQYQPRVTYHVAESVSDYSDESSMKSSFLSRVKRIFDW